MSVLYMTALALGRAIQERRISVPEALSELFARATDTENALHAYVTKSQ